MTRRARRRLPLPLELILLAAVALGAAFVVKAVLVQAFVIPSASMEPGLVEDDRIVVEKPSYWFGGSPQRGDVVVFEDPGGWLSAEESGEPEGFLRAGLAKVGLYPVGGHLVKRVIGVGGDVVVCCDDQGRVSVNGVALEEDDYLAPEDAECHAALGGSCEWTAGPVPEGHLFVLGDNRGNSADSRAHMCAARATGCEPGGEFVDADLVVGKVLALTWPIGRMALLDRPETFDAVPDQAAKAGHPEP